MGIQLSEIEETAEIHDQVAYFLALSHTFLAIRIIIFPLERELAFFFFFF